MSGTILVFCEQRRGQLKNVALEALGEARRLAPAFGGNVAAALFGRSVEGLAPRIAAAGADTIHLADDSLLEEYGSEAYVRTLVAVVEATRPIAVLMGATSLGKDLAPALAARIQSPILSDCISLSADGKGLLTAVRPVYGGKLRATMTFAPGTVQIITLRPNVFAPLSPPVGTPPVVEKVGVRLDPTTLSAKLRDIVATAGSKVELTEANTIVSGGRGLKGPENFHLVEELAEALGAAVGASRAAVDAGWKPHAYQVGLTGKTVSPSLYIACGISGAVQHQAGMSSSKVIVAINKDPNAPIFKIATYGIVGDLFEILPVLTAEIKKLRAGG